MKRLTIIGILALTMTGCKGPRHISDEEFEHGQIAFKFLEDFQHTQSVDAFKKASEEMQKLPPTSSTYQALFNYQTAAEHVMQGTATKAEVLACHDEAESFFEETPHTAGECDKQIHAHYVLNP